MKGIAGVAFLAALVLGAPFAIAQSPYGVGGYLERPYLPDDDEPGVTAPENSAAEAARRRRQRALAPAEQPQSSQSGAASQQQPQASPPTTGATQGGGPRRSASEAAQRRAQGLTDNNPPNAAVPNYREVQPQPQRRAVRANQGDEPSSTQQQRQRENAAASRSQGGAGEPRRQRAQAEETSRKADDETPVPPVPLRRPKFADAPARSVVTALASPEPTPQEAAPQVAPADAAQAQAVEAPPPQEAVQSPAEGTPPQAEQSAAMLSISPAENPAADMGTEPSAPAPGPEAATAPDATPAQVASSETAPPTGEAPQDASSASDSPAAEPQPDMRAAVEVPEPSPDTSAPMAEASTPAAAPPAETPPPASPVAAATPPAEAPAPKPAEPSVAEAEPAAAAEAVKTPSQAEAEKPVGVEQQTALAPSSQPEAEQPAAKPPAEPAALAEAQPIAPEPAANPPAPVAAAPPAVVPAAAPPVQDVVPALPAKPMRVATAGDTAVPVPQPPARQATGLDKVIGQMLVVGFRGLTPEESWPQKLAAQIKAGTIGGVLFMSHNVQSPQQLKTLTTYLQKVKSDIPMLFAVDQEGGIVQRLSAEKGFQDYPTAGKIGRSNDPLTAYSVYRRLAAELSENGFNLNLGPVVDLLRSDASPIIAGKERSFGSQPKHVAAFAKAFCIAHQDEGVLTVLKHFPGHGSTPFDTHVQPVNVGSSWTEDEIVPYRELIASRNAQAVMMGHIANPSMSDEAGQPASLSAKAIRQVLRGDLGFTGVVISDDLEMGAIRARFSLEDSAVKAIKAGNDMVILSNQNAPNPDLPERITAAIKKAVEAGELRTEDLQASYDRILGLKQRLPGAVAPATSGNAGGKSSGSKRASSDRGGRSASARQ